MSKRDELEAALLDAFPAITVDRATINEPTAIWVTYTDYPGLAEFEGKSWRELSPDLLEQHPTLPVYAGDELWRRTLPGFLRYLLRGQAEYTELPHQVARQLTRRPESGYDVEFERRIAPLTMAQRAAVFGVLAALATTPELESVMTPAVATWRQLCGGA